MALPISLYCLLVQCAQMLVHHGNRVRELPAQWPRRCRSCAAASCCLVVAQLIEQAFAQVAACHSRRIHLAHDVQGFVQICQRKANVKRDAATGVGVAGSTGGGLTACSSAGRQQRRFRRAVAGRIATA